MCLTIREWHTKYICDAMFVEGGGGGGGGLEMEISRCGLME